MPDPSPTFGFRGLLRGVPAPVWAITGLFFLILSFHTVLAPLYRAPDEARHIDQVLALREARGYPPPGKEVLSQEVLGSYSDAGYAQRGPHGIGVPDPRTDIRTPLPLTKAEAPDLGKAPAFKDVPPLQRPVAQLNQMTQHPPGYYALGAAVLWVIPRDQHLPFPIVIGILRMLSVVCVAPLPLFIFNAARRLSVGSAAALAASAVPLAIPELGEIAGSVSNDNLLNGLMALLTVALVFVATGDLSRKTAVKVGLITGLALFTKAFALAALPWIVVAYAVALYRTRSRLAVGGAIIAGLTSLVGGWWYVVSFFRYGSIQSEQTIKATYAKAPATFHPSITQYVDEFADKVPTRFWGDFGYLEVALPKGFTTSATIAVLALLVLGLLRVRPWLPGATLLVPFAGVGAIMVAGTYGLYKDYGIFPGLQGRYLYPALAAIAVLVGCGVALLFRQAAPAVALATALGCQAYGMHYELAKVWSGSLSTLVAWSWISGWVVYLVAVAIVVGSVAAVLLAARDLVPRFRQVALA